MQKEGLYPNDKEMFVQANKMYTVHKGLMQKFHGNAQDGLENYSTFLDFFNELFLTEVQQGSIPDTLLPSDVIVQVRPNVSGLVLCKNMLQIVKPTKTHEFAVNEFIKTTQIVNQTKPKIPDPPLVSKDTPSITVHQSYESVIQKHNENKLRSVFDNTNHSQNYSLRFTDILKSYDFIDTFRMMFKFVPPIFGDEAKSRVSVCKSKIDQIIMTQTKHIGSYPSVVRLDDSNFMTLQAPLLDMYLNEKLLNFYGTTDAAILHHIFQVFGSKLAFSSAYEDFTKKKRSNLKKIEGQVKNE